MKLAKQGRIHLDLDEVVESNRPSIIFSYMFYLRHWGHVLVLFNASHQNHKKHKCCARSHLP